MISTIILQKKFWTECNNNNRLKVEWSYSVIWLTNQTRRICILFFHLLKEVQNCSIEEPERTTLQSTTSNMFHHQFRKTFTRRALSSITVSLIKIKVILVILITFTTRKSSLLINTKSSESCTQVVSISEDWHNWRMLSLILMISWITIWFHWKHSMNWRSKRWDKNWLNAKNW